MSTTDDALDVARFCWPNFTWKGGALWCVWTEEYGNDSYCWRFTPDRFDSAPQDGSQKGIHGISAAERVLVERGLGEAYGRELIRQLIIPSNTVTPVLLWSEITTIRTAPLEVCLRAMARVVREQRKPKENEA